MSFMERNRVVLGLITAALIVGGTVLALSLQRGIGRGGYTVTVALADAAGLRPGDQVVIAGARTGKVLDVELVDDHVEATARVEDVELPADTEARVILRTLVGRRSLELVAGSDWDRLLEDGDVIPVERTSLPTDVPEFGDVAQQLLSEVDSPALSELFRALTDVTRGQRDQVSALIAGGTRLTGLVNDEEEQVRALLDRLVTVSGALAARDDELVGIIEDFGTVVAELSRRRGELQRLLRATDQTSGQAADLVAAKRAEIDRILDEVHVLTGILSRHEIDLAEAVGYSGDSIVGFASIARAGELEVPWGHVFVTSLGAIGMDVLVGCGGLVDQQLDRILGPDPRTCEEQQGNEPPPFDPTAPGEPVAPGTAGPTGMRGVPQRSDVSSIARRVLEGAS